jgi:peptidoglycan hydrolase CwlO-like protein
MKKLLAWVLGLGVLLILINSFFSLTSDGVNTIQKEFAISNLLKKYEYFKDLSSAIQKKQADIEYYKQQLSEETDKFEKTQLKAEMRGIVTIHNQLVSEYNAAMSKFNYRFTNVGDLPQSNLQPLPREFNNYIIK